MYIFSCWGLQLTILVIDIEWYHMSTSPSGFLTPFSQEESQCDGYANKLATVGS